MLEWLYRKWGISDKTNFSAMGPEDWPIAEDLYAVLEDAYEHYDREDSPLYPRELLRELLLGLHSMCRGAESVYFNGRTNITSARFLVFGVKDLIHANSSVKDALLFNLLSYLSDQLLTKGNTVAALDELYLWLSNLTTIEYIRNCLKRVRKRNSALILASQNLEDFDIQGVRELTRPLFAIPTHQFLFHGGKVDKKFYMDNLQLESAEYDLISSPNNGVCLFKSGADRNLLDVHAPPHKHALITGAEDNGHSSPGAQAAASILANEKSRKAVGWVLIAVLSPIILLLAFFCTTFSGGAEHNRTVADLCFHGGAVPEAPRRSIRHTSRRCGTALSCWMPPCRP